MTQRAKLNIELNQPTEIELLFDEPISGKSQYGPYNMYAVIAGDEEFTFFPVDEVHEQLKTLKRGDRATITKLAAQRGNKVVTSYDVQTSVKKEPVSTSADQSDIPEDRSTVIDSTQSIAGDNFYETMLHSYRDALKIQKVLNSMINIERIAVTIFIARSKSNSY